TVPTDTQVYPARLHGAACALLEEPSVPHTAQHKPFSVGPLIDAGAGWTRWRVGWRAPTPPPRRPPQGSFGPTPCALRPPPPLQASFAELLASPPRRHAELRFLSPTYFARNGRDFPLPDPVLVMRSLATRWDAHAPAELALPAKEVS